MKKQKECGRTLTETVSVLAIMGILGVAGVAGYNNAMNKHRANELLNEASKRAVVVVGQFLNRNTASLSEFLNHNSVAGATFTDTTVEKDANNQFTLTITGVTEAICKHMQNMKTTLIQKFEPSDCATSATVKLTYNADMSAGSTGTVNDQTPCESNGEYRCSSGKVQKCIGGMWTLTTDSGKVCNGDVAENIHCNSENHLKTRCRNGVYQLCHWDGPGQFYNETPPAGKICDGDNLVDNPDAKCTVGDARCRDGDYEECKQDGTKTRWIAWDVWPEGYLCEGDTLVEEVDSCIQDSQRCLNSIHYWCDEGQWYYEPISYLVECEGDHFVCVEEGQKACEFYLPILDYTYLECQNGELTPITPPAGKTCDYYELVDA